MPEAQPYKKTFLWKVTRIQHLTQGPSGHSYVALEMSTLLGFVHQTTGQQITCFPLPFTFHIQVH